MAKKFVLFAAALVIGLSAAPLIHGQGIGDLQTQIQTLLAQIKQLQAQFDAAQGGSAAQWCHTFGTNLGQGSSGSEVAALQQALSKEGIDVGSDTDSQTYDDNTASAVSGFQEKYRSEILDPSGLKYPTGFAGKATRAKLNSLYGCSGVTVPPVRPPVTGGIKVYFPSAGNAWYVGQTYKIAWSGGAISLSASNQVNIILSPPQPACLSANPPCAIPTIAPYTIIPYTIASGTEDNGVYTWTIPSTLPSHYMGTEYVTVQTTDGFLSGTSEAFTISNPTTSSGSAPVISGVSGPTALSIGQQGTWTVNASDPQNGTLAYSVLWGDETLVGTTNGMPGALIYPQPTYQQSATFAHTYNIAGNYIPKFTVKNSSGASTQTSISVSVGSVTSAQPSITVLSPNGGEIWNQGTTQTITWQDSASLPPCAGLYCPSISSVTYDITLISSSPSSGFLTNSSYLIASNVGGFSYNWLIGGPAGNSVINGSYRVKICQSGSTANCDLSNASFSIVSANTATTTTSQVDSLSQMVSVLESAKNTLNDILKLLSR